MAELIKMIIAASSKMTLLFRDGSKIGELDGEGLVLRWPAWYQPTASDMGQMASALSTLIDASIISQQTSTKTIAATFDIEDIDAERALIEAERAKRDANAQKQIKIEE